MSEPTAEQAEGLDAARHLARHGVPIFLARPADEFPSGGTVGGYWLPKDWQRSAADPAVLDAWRPGMAVCAVMGHAVDALDVDPQNGGDLSALDCPVPTSYGRQRTPSGGTHDLIASLGVPSHDGVRPGVDLKAGADGAGHGFVFIAPTVKVSKATGEVAAYSWEVEPDLDALAVLGDDGTGAGLRETLASRRSLAVAPVSYAGPAYEDLTADQRARADRHVETALFDWAVRLGAASGWPEGETDDKGRGWERLATDAAWALMRLAVCPWTGLDLDDARTEYDRLLPDALAANERCRDKWTASRLTAVQATPVDPPPWLDPVFDETPVLRQVRQAAHAQMVAPSGLLVVTLLRVLAEVPPTTVLPPVIGDVASLNLGGALVAGSGGGKSATVKVSRRLLGLVGENQKELEEGMGSGEGLIDLFLQPERAPNSKGELKPTGQYVLKDDPRVILNTDEVEQMGAVGSDRKGSTLNSNLRTALTGGPLKTSNAKAGGRYRAVEEDAYRLVAVVGIQPEASGVLLSSREAAVGTPQRFLWASVLDPDRPRTGRPEWPGDLGWEPPPEWPAQVEYPQHVRDAIVAARERFLDGLAGPLEGHLNLTRLKVAFALAVLHREVALTDRWWRLAGLLVEASLAEQAACRAVLGETAQRGVTQRRVAESRADEAAVEDRLKRAVAAVVATLRKQPGQARTWREIKPASRLLVGLDTSEVVAALEQEEGVTAEEYTAKNKGTAWRLRWDG